MTKHIYDVARQTAYLHDGGLVETTCLIRNAMAMGVDTVQVAPDHAMALAILAGQSLTCAGSNVGALREASAWAALAAKNMAALEKAVGAAIPDTYVFGSVPVADLSGALQLTAGDIRALAAAFHATGDAQAPAAVALPADVRRLVIAARAVAFGHQTPEEIKELDAASEAFASRLAWEDEPVDVEVAA